MTVVSVLVFVFVVLVALGDARLATIAASAVIGTLVFR